MPFFHPGLCAVSSAAVRLYHVVDELKTMTEAQSHCIENYMDLATIRDLNTLKRTVHSLSLITSVRAMSQRVVQELMCRGIEESV